ncbi:MAG: 16S rRNA (cytosine(967)-C(5))-methyltransferase RsmB [Lachnospiraceae bacterium]|nr:16S rRNA (cytosine(967)-C(5))-methyltransferase RsmB [Lachnospiraceae bacterium]
MTDSVNIRGIALDILMEVLENQQYSHLVIRDVLDKYQYLEKRERSFLTRIAEGTIERKIELDYVVDQFSKMPVRKQKPVIRNILRMGVYQLLHMDSVPDSAVCNEAVKLAKKRGFSQLSGFVNGVLRNIARGREQIVWPDENRDLLTNWEVTYSMPRWILEQWERAYGRERTRRILDAFGEQNPLTVRTNLNQISTEELVTKLEGEGVTVKRNMRLPYALELSGFDFLNGLESFLAGDFYIQDLSSMMVAHTADPKPGDYIIDVCAAPGGKSTHLAEMMRGTGMVEARDLTDYKVGLLEENIARHGLTNMKAICWDATVFDEASVEKADILICDLPCSGLGVMGKKTDIRYKMTPEKQGELVQLQREILRTVCSYVKRGGTLVYSTCTIHTGENEENVEWFLQEHPEFTLVSREQMFPGDCGNDGFFIAKMKRNGNE